MSNASKFVASSIEEILLGIADGIYQAQDKLNDIEPFDAYGRPNMQYHLPYLDFNIKLMVETQPEPEPKTSDRISIHRKKDLRPAATLRFLPMNVQTQNDNFQSEMVSTLSGRFVSIPPNEGLPQIMLQAIATKSSSVKNSYDLAVNVTNSVGEYLDAISVEFNIDYDASTEMSLLDGIELENPRFFLTSGVMLTDHLGNTNNQLRLADNIPVGASIVIGVNVGTTLTRLMIVNGGDE